MCSPTPRTYRQHLSAYTAPILADDDPVYREVAIPRRFWKIAAWSTTDAGSDETSISLAATGYLLDQSQQLDAVPKAATRTGAAEAPPPLGQYLTYQLPIIDIATPPALTSAPRGRRPTGCG